ncbi:OmpA family protein, partial [Lysobacter enzymogenes]|uniref:DUF7507 domain-containing protein n=1 Tax=Lysobacter enzymogenes TaxID=69 RepID=UPI00384DB25A
VLTGTYTVVQADVDAGKVLNNALVTDPTVCPAGSTDPKCTTKHEEPIIPAPNLSLKKERTGLTDTDNSGGVSLGDTLTYTITATNTGNTTLTNVVVSDDKITPASTTCASVAPAGTCVLTGTYTVVQADVDAGKVLNNALVTDPTVCPAGSTDPKCKTNHEEPITPAPNLSLKKERTGLTDTDNSGGVSLGDTLTYTVTATNTGNTTLTNVVVSDDKIAPASTTCASLAPGGTCVLTGTYKVVQADVDAGKVLNSALVTDPTVCPAGSTDPKCKTNHEEPITATPSLELTKTAGVIVDTDTPANGAGDVGDTVAYTFAVKNTGNVVLTNVNVTDPLLPSLACTAIATLAPGASQTLTCTAGNVYTLTQTDVNNGKVDNTATGTGTTPSGGTVSDTDSKTVTISAAPNLSLKKERTGLTDTDNSGGVSLGDTLTYTVTATNTGNTTLTNVVVSDDKITPASTTCASVAPAGTCVLTGTYKVVQADVDAGKVLNSALVTDPTVCPSGSTDPKCTTKHEEPITPAPNLSLKKERTGLTDTDNSGGVSLGDTLTYTITATNTGNTTLTNVVVSDDKITPASTTCASLAPGGTCVLTGTYKVVQADVDAGKVLNSALVTDPTVCPAGSTDPKCKTNHEEPITATPSLELTKTAGAIIDTDTPANGAGDVGDTVAYTFAVKNTGNVVLTNVNVTDPLLPSLACTAIATLAPGASQTLTCTSGNVYTLTQTDVNNGKVDNTATGTGTTPSGGTVSDTDSKTVTISAAPNLSLKKERTGLTDTDNSGGVSLGDTLTYTVTATNTGNTTLTNVVVSDDKITPASTTCASVAPAGTCVLTGTYKVVQADVDAGKVLNNALVTDPTVCPAGSTDPKCKTNHEEPIARNSDLTSVKSVTANADEDGSHSVTVGDTLTYSVIVTNIGTVPLTNVVVADNKITPSTTTCATVAPSQTCVLTGTYKVSLADANAGIVRNAATVTAETPPGVPSPCTAGATDPKCNPKHDEPVIQAPGLKSAKTMDRNADEDGDGRISVGDTLTYSITVTNTGNTTLTDVVVTDSKIAPNTIACASVAPGGTCVLTGTYKVVQADVDAAAVVNTATVTTATPNVCPAGSTDAACKPTVTVQIQARPAVDIRKVATLSVDNGTPGVGNVGDVISYAVRITNTGNISLNEMATRDVLQNYAPTQLKCGAATLAPGAFVDCEAYTHTITHDEARAAGTLDNVVTVTAKYGSAGGGGQTTGTATATSTAIMRVEPDPSTDLVVSKEARPQRVKIGDLVRYTVTIKNVGDTDAIDAVMTDTPPAGFSLVDGSVQVADRDGQGRLIGTYPVGVDGIDIQAGQSATVVYLLRVGAAVRPGSHVNSAYAEDGGKRSNVATAAVELASDPMLDDSLLIGTVFDDRDEDRWQDPASLTDLRVQGGFAPGAYIAHSTTVDRGDGARPEPDASSPMLHGIDLGKIAGRQSDADPVAAHTVTISQLLREPSFTDDFALTNAQGVTVRMDAAGNTRVERSGDAAKGLTGADPQVERRVAKADGGYRVDYIVSNRGVDERGIPGVRVASVEGLLVETDQFGRYHLEGVAGGPWERGRNFILKVDPATLPPGSKLTTDNPLVRRLTPGVPVRFDFGVKLPPGEIPGPKQEVEMRIGEVFFDAGSAEVKPAYLPAVDNMAAKVREYGGGEVVITADGETQALAMDRALAVRKALESKLTPELLNALQISVRTDARDPNTMVVGFAEWPKLGEVLFDTDRSTIKPQYLPLMAKIAAALDELRGYRVTIVGHTDKRASDAYNIALGMRRAQAVYDAILAHASPEVRKTLRVDTSNDPDAPAGEKEKSGATR